MNLQIDWSFFTWDLFSNFVLKGLYFSLTLTVIATIGGVLFGTVLALMRLSGKKWLDVPATLYVNGCLLYTSPSPRDVEESRMPSSA